MIPAVLEQLVVLVAKRSLEGTFSSAEIREIVSETRSRYDRERRSLPSEEGLGGKLMVRLAALSVSFYRTLCKRGLNREQARASTARAAWLVYRWMARVPETLSAWRRDPRERLEGRIRLFRSFPFGPPSYDVVDVPAPRDTVAFDVLRCPVADYFSTRGLSKLCEDAFCDLDFPLAKRWGAFLQRTGTRAGGASRCDFRWRIAPRPTGPGPTGGVS